MTTTPDTPAALTATTPDTPAGTAAGTSGAAGATATDSTGPLAASTPPAPDTTPVPASVSPPSQHRTIPPGDDAVLASDSEREHVAGRLREAAAEGRLTLDEADERQTAAYAARTRAELVPLLAGLPRPPRPRRRHRGPLTPRARRNLGVHAGVTAAVLLFLLVVAILGPAPLFMPIGPAFWLGLILFVHSRRAEREPSPDDAVPDELR